MRVPTGRGWIRLLSGAQSLARSRWAVSRPWKQTEGLTLSHRAAPTPLSTLHLWGLETGQRAVGILPPPPPSPSSSLPLPVQPQIHHSQGNVPFLGNRLKTSGFVFSLFSVSPHPAERGLSGVLFLKPFSVVTASAPDRNGSFVKGGGKC